MSHFAELKVNVLVKNEEDLIETLKEKFGEDAVEVHDKAQKLTGYDKAANREAHIVIRKETVKKVLGTYGWNDLGFERQDDGTFALHADPTDWREEDRNQVIQNYAEKVASRKLKAQGYILKREVLKDGKVKLVATKYG